MHGSPAGADRCTQVPTVAVTMNGSFARCRGVVVVLIAGIVLFAAMLVGCDRLRFNEEPPESTQRPTAPQLKLIAYMSQAKAGPDGRNIFDHLEQAKSCRDFELAMRWNRPPDVQGGPFDKKMVYLSSGIPGDLPKEAEVVIAGRIERGELLSSGSSGWSLRMKDGSEIQAIEPAEYWQKQQQTQAEGGAAAVVKPYTPGRALCGTGIYQGLIGRAPGRPENVPLFSVLFVMDRRR
jgi:hypothetical protein